MQISKDNPPGAGMPPTPQITPWWRSKTAIRVLLPLTVLLSLGLVFLGFHYRGLLCPGSPQELQDVALEFIVNGGRDRVTGRLNIFVFREQC